MYGRLITLLVVVLFGLIGTYLGLQWIQVKMFGNAGPPKNTQQTHASKLEDKKSNLEDKKATLEDKKEKKTKYEAKVAEQRAKDYVSPETIARVVREESPRMLSVSQFAPDTGKVTWPELLLADEYEQPRKELERLLKRPAAISDDNSVKAHAAAEQMITTLKENIRGLSIADYIAAHKFLDSLAFMIVGKGPQ